MSGNSEMKNVCRSLERRGYAVEKTRGGHLRITHPAMAGPVFAAHTPSDHRAIKNLLAMLRRKLSVANDN